MCSTGEPAGAGRALLACRTERCIRLPLFCPAEKEVLAAHISSDIRSLFIFFGEMKAEIPSGSRAIICQQQCSAAGGACLLWAAKYARRCSLSFGVVSPEMAAAAPCPPQAHGKGLLKGNMRENIR